MTNFTVESYTLDQEAIEFGGDSVGVHKNQKPL
ncbi:hypothetical protein QFZ72_005903 [Bacillus sp. V2I10]|nr:hypothetical protein [Bacillus sp. V2I10]